MTCHCFLRPIRRDLTSSSYTTGLSLGSSRGVGESSFSLKIRPILIPASAIANNGVTIRDLIGRDEKRRGRGKRKVSIRNFKRGYVKTRCLRNERFLSSDEYCVKETNEEKRKQRNIMARFIESWGLRGSVFSFSLHLPLHSSFHGCSLSPTFAQ